MPAVKKKYVHVWVIRSIKKQSRAILGHKKVYLYHQTHTAVSNPRFAAQFHFTRKHFPTKKSADTWFFKKVRYGIDMHEYKVARKKVFLDKDGYIDYWRNR